MSFTCRSPGLFFYADLVLFRPVMKDGAHELVLGWWYRNSLFVRKFGASCWVWQGTRCSRAAVPFHTFPFHSLSAPPALSAALGLFELRVHIGFHVTFRHQHFWLWHRGAEPTRCLYLLKWSLSLSLLGVKLGCGTGILSERLHRGGIFGSYYSGYI